tara:strand:+ start:2839 stop:5766 length:2928 start_codon:yes stop_codon:yes gene_type:complete
MSGISQKSIDKDILIKQLNTLENLTSNRGDIFRARAYKRASEALMSLEETCITLEHVKDKEGIGKTIIEKFKEFMETGKINAIEKEKSHPIHIFSKIYGVGPKKAEELSKSFKTINELRDGLKKEPKLLNDKQTVGLQYYESILERIPREEIDIYNKIVQEIVSKMKTGIKGEIVGSYRRGSKNSGDIDIIITSDNPKDFDKFIELFKSYNIIEEILSKGSKKCLAIGKLENKLSRRIDFMYTSPKEYPYAILYFTGSKEFNVKMRLHALKMGLTLNEHELKYLDASKTSEFSLNTEKDVFEFLNLEYVEPKDRNSNNFQVKKKDKTTDKEIEETQSTKNIKVKKGVLKKPKKSIIQKDQQTMIEDLVSKIKEASDAYYNGKAILSDFEFDRLQEQLQSIDPNNPVLSEIGAPIKDGKKVELPFFMPSMDKVKPESIEKWLKKYTQEYVISAKLDGVSAMYIKSDKGEFLYTRGNGIMGQDISILLPYINIHRKFDKNIVVRGELIISDENFEKHFTNENANARNTVSGLISQKKPNEKYLKYVDFVCYEVIQPSLKPLEQFQFSDKIGLNTVKYEYYKNLDVSLVQKILLDWRKDYKYSIDGIIITQNSIYKRTKENPKHSVAFKMIMQDQKAVSKVTTISWQISKHGLAKPVVNIEPTKIGGVVIRKISGQNAKFIKENKIGPKAVVEVVRRGDVIPYIEKIVTPSKLSGLPDFDYTWTDTQVDIFVKNNDEMEEKKILAFITGYEVDGIGIGVIQKLRKNGFQTLKTILNIEKDDLLKIDGFGIKKSEKILEGIQKMKKEFHTNIPKFMALSGCFGRGMGEKKITEVISKYPHILQDYIVDKEDDLITNVMEVPGFSTKTSTQFVLGISSFKEFCDEIDVRLDIKSQTKTQSKSQSKSQTLSGNSFLFTGFRDKNLEKEIIEKGGDIKSSLSKSTTYLIVKDETINNTKTQKAVEYGAKVITTDMLKKMLMS